MRASGRQHCIQPSLHAANGAANTMNAQAHLRIVPHPANVGTLLENGWRVPRTTQLKSGGQARSTAAHHRLRIEEAHQETL